MLPKRTDDLEGEPTSAVGAPGEAPQSSSRLRASALEPISSEMEALLPLSVSPKWVAYACRMAGLAKPRWSRTMGVWTTTYQGDSGTIETVTIRKGDHERSKSVHVLVEWLGWQGQPAETATARRLVATFITGMQWSLRQQSQTRMSLVQRRLP